MNNMNMNNMNMNNINMNNMNMNNINMNNMNMNMNKINMNNNMNMNDMNKINMNNNMNMNDMNKINNNNSQENNIKKKDLNDTILPILLIHLQNVDEKDKKKEISNKKEKLKEELSKKYYKIENDKNKEIENFFKSPKSKEKLKGASILSNNKIYTLPKKNIIKLYDINGFKEIYTINCKKEEKIDSAIELDNKDLIISVKEKGVYKLLVYRLNNKTYNLIQTIEELTGKLRKNLKGYYHDKPIYGNVETKFELEVIKKLANNRFMSKSNYEIKLYSLNKTNSYEIILLYNDNSSSKYIYEIDDENYLIIDSNYIYTNYFYNIAADYPDHYTKKEMVIKKIKLNKIKETEKEKILNDNKKYIKFTNLISSIKLIASEENSTCINNALLSDYIILKKKYLLIQSCFTFYILNLANLEQLAKYKIQIFGEKKILTFDNMSIEKWKCTDDNEFLLKLRGNVTLFKLEEKNENKIKLNVIAYSYFPKLGALNRINEENRFIVFDGDDEYIEVY